MKNLLNVQIGDKVWDIEYGWGIVEMIWDDRIICVDVSFNGYYCDRFYTLDGKKDFYDRYPCLFFDIPKLYKENKYPQKTNMKFKKRVILIDDSNL